ncbi:GNAT family N-acetyltransferase [Marivibrio halodurans]|uniref:GNAT family N-acetyltransferase n=1 Tax=Marivibrio halodurans TaxID=2039722 RepID=A0A8J7V1C3_9PROT|nr:GNAT family N-acetyltransferase [Marivibrio halodurans]MBP5857641.1 GNAT family N-acetyltransferase [Marivibrio halodurans]
MGADDPALPHIARRINETWADSHTYSLAETTAWLRDTAGAASEAVFLARAGEDPVGCALLVANDLPWPAAEGPWLSSLLVEPGWRRTGIAGRLIEAVAARAAMLGHANLYLYCVPGALARYYATRGFAPVEPVTIDGRPYQVMKHPLAHRRPSPTNGVFRQ